MKQLNKKEENLRKETLEKRVRTHSPERCLTLLWLLSPAAAVLPVKGRKKCEVTRECEI